MPTLTTLAWTDSLAVGNAVIDAEHKETVDHLAALAAADETTFPALFAAFARHLRDHLAHEEALMRQYGFPPYPIHKREHDRVRLELEGLEERLAAGDLTQARVYACEVVPEWFIRHKNTMDAATAAWIRSQGG